MTGTRCTLRPYRPDDLPAVMELYERVWGRSFRKFLERIWGWKYEQGPFTSNAPERRLVVEQDGRIVGFRGYRPMEFKLGSVRRMGAWLGDFMVDPEARGHAGLLIARDTVRGPGTYFGTAGKPIVELWSRMYGRDCTATRLTWVRRELKVARVLVDAIRAGHRLARAPRTPDGAQLDVEPATSPDVLGGVLDDLVASHDCIARRTVDHLRWRFFDCPYGAHRMFVARRGAQIAGYLVLRADLPDVALVVDALAALDDEPAYCALLGAALREASRGGKRAVEALKPRQPGGFARALAATGFLPPIRHHRECHVVGKDIDPRLDDLVHAHARWYVTPADTDIDMREA